MKTFYYSNLVNKVEEIQSTFYNNHSKYGWKTYKKMGIQKERNMLKFSPCIIPERYVWHLSYPCFRESILTNGIIPNYEEHHVLFVNAQIENPFKLWPIVYDDCSAMFNWDDYENEDDAFYAFNDKMLCKYDFWRIDSEIAGYEGYHIDINDPAFMSNYNHEKGLFGARPDDYICREKPIKAAALKLFQYKKGSIRHYFSCQCNNEPLHFNMYDGVASVCGFDKSNPYYLEEVTGIIFLQS